LNPLFSGRIIHLSAEDVRCAKSRCGLATWRKTLFQFALPEAKIARKLTVGKLLPQGQG
jgi:hypothetical protein